MDFFLDIKRLIEFVDGEPVNVNQKGQLQTSSNMNSRLVVLPWSPTGCSPEHDTESDLSLPSHMGHRKALVKSIDKNNYL